ncbi:MAG TPA: hypothetical protein VFP49_11350, partial [Nitrososphaeraceae archaeon]|nr:hypothetical protein [Nitrososphaeraceae archaeon]
TNEFNGLHFQGIYHFLPSHGLVSFFFTFYSYLVPNLCYVYFDSLLAYHFLYFLPLPTSPLIIDLIL